MGRRGQHFQDQGQSFFTIRTSQPANNMSVMLRNKMKSRNLKMPQCIDYLMIQIDVLGKYILILPARSVVVQSGHEVLWIRRKTKNGWSNEERIIDVGTGFWQNQVWFCYVFIVYRRHSKSCQACCAFIFPVRTYSFVFWRLTFRSSWMLSSLSSSLNFLLLGKQLDICHNWSSKRYLRT